MVRSDSVAPPAPADDHIAGLVRALLLGAAEQATIGVAPAVTPALGEVDPGTQTRAAAAIQGLYSGGLCSSLAPAAPALLPPCSPGEEHIPHLVGAPLLGAFEHAAAGVDSAVTAAPGSELLATPPGAAALVAIFGVLGFCSGFCRFCSGVYRLHCSRFCLIFTIK